jgi:hypothetical protein
VWTRNDRVFDSVRIQAVGYLGEGPHVRSRPAGPLGFEEDFEGYSPVQVLKRIHVHSLPLGEKVARCFTLFS